MSPIHGLSEQRRLPRIAKIHLGVKKVSERTHQEYPSATEYFVIPEEIVPYMALMGNADPQHPTQLAVMIPVEDPEMWCQQYYKCYSRTRGLVCRGDGITCRRMIDAVTGEKAHRDSKEVVWKEDLKCEGRECAYYKNKECKETMNLQVLMPDVPGLGVWQIDTSSINSIRNINSDAELVRAVYKRVSFIPLLLTLEPQEVINPDDGKKKTVRCLHLRSRGTIRELMLEAAKPVTELLMPGPAEDEPPMDAVEEVEAEVVTEKKQEPLPETSTDPITDAEAEDIQQKLFGEGSANPSVFKAATKSVESTKAPRFIEVGQINALMSLTNAMSEVDLRVKAEVRLKRELKSITQVTHQEAAAWIIELQPKRVRKS